MLMDILIVLIKGIILVSFLMAASAYMVLAERIVMARMQMRLGPVRVGPLGLLQPLADGLKLLTKERFQPKNIDSFIYWLAPCISLFLALAVFSIIPVGGTIHVWGHPIKLQIADVNAGVLFFLALSSLSVYGIVLAGWSSNNRYSLLGWMRHS